MTFFPARIVHKQGSYRQLNLVPSKTSPILRHRRNPVISDFPLVLSVEHRCHLSHFGCYLSDVCSRCFLFLSSRGIRASKGFNSSHQGGISFHNPIIASWAGRFTGFSIRRTWIHTGMSRDWDNELSSRNVWNTPMSWRISDFFRGLRPRTPAPTILYNDQ